MSIPQRIPFVLALVLFVRTDEADFDKDLQKALSLMERGKWSKARDEILEVLARHEGASYAMVRRTELLEDLKRCSFRMQFPEAGFESLVSGRLVSYDERSGAVHLVYGPDDLDDFEVQKGKGAPIYLHPMVFDAGYTIEIEGENYPAFYSGQNETFGGSPAILACIGADASYQALFGLPAGNADQWIPPRLRKIENGEVEVVDERKSPPALPGKKYKLKLQVTSSKVVATYNGKEVVSARKGDGYGRFGFANMVELEEITLKGKIQPAWLQGLRDQVTTAALAEFEKGWDPGQVAPEWLLAAPAPATERYTESMYPGPESVAQVRFCNQAIDHLNAGRLDEGLEYVEDLTTEDVTAEAKLFLEVLFLKALGRQEEALEKCEALCTLDDHHLGSRMMLAELYLVLLPRADAITEFEAILEDFPDAPEAYQELAMLLLRDGRPAECKALVNRAITAGVPVASLDALNRTLVRAEKGPQWGTVYEYASRNYLVQSDIGKDLCVEASRMLEEAYRSYSIRLFRIQDLERNKFRVFLFSGEAGYRAYALDTLGSTPESTAGLYSSTLKQLLIWNLPDRADMMRTIRHEGFHQYLDRVMDNPPRWFNEGLAEYYEIADLIGSDWVEGQPHPYHMQRFADPDTRLVPLDDFLFMGPARFYGEHRDLHYSQAWAFVHFLRHGDRDRKALFERLFEGFRGKSNREVLDEVFGGMDLVALQGELEAHIAGMK